MKKIVFLIAMCVFADSALAAMTPVTGRGNARNTTVRASGGRDNMRAASVKVQSTPAQEITTNKSSLKVDNEEANIAINDESQVMNSQKEQEKDMREKEKRVCLSNNIGVGNTFVWASRYSDTSSYVTMIEDVEEPENNVCFVKLALKSSDPNVDVSDIPSKYFVMGENITCGSWTDEEMLRKRILDAKKSSRTWATVGGAVGGAALGVGAMELFGNKIIGGAVEGQYSMNDQELLRSRLLVLKKESPSEYNKFVKNLESVEKICKDDDVRSDTDADDICDEYVGLLDLIQSSN